MSLSCSLKVQHLTQLSSTHIDKQDVRHNATKDQTPATPHTCHLYPQPKQKYYNSQVIIILTAVCHRLKQTLRQHVGIEKVASSLSSYRVALSVSSVTKTLTANKVAWHQVTQHENKQLPSSTMHPVRDGNSWATTKCSIKSLPRANND